jgi:hypothetical protein
VHSLEPELRELHSAGVIDDATASRAIALESGSVFSVFEELRATMYAAVALIFAGLGILVRNNLDRIGPLTLIVMLALAGAACYVGAIRARLRGEERSVGGDYLLLLGALIVSVDLGYGESQFHWLGADWSQHLLLLAVLHAVTAYALDSPLVLSVALTSLAGWLGVARTFGNVFGPGRPTADLGLRALICAAVILGGYAADRRISSKRRFDEVFEHFGANLAFWGSLAWCFNDPLRLPGVLLLAALGTFSILKGLRAAQEAFVVYGVVYTALGVSVVLAWLIRDPLPTAIVALIVLIGAAVLLWKLHERLKERAQ